MPGDEIGEFFFRLRQDPNLHAELVRRSTNPAQYHANAARFARMLGYEFTTQALGAWVAEHYDGGLPPGVSLGGATARSASDNGKVLSGDDLFRAGASRPMGRNTTLSIRDWLRGGRS